MFASGCPILIWCACFNHLLCYVCDKYLLLRISKRPPAYDQEVIQQSVSALPTALLLHCGFGVWMLGNVEVFPSTEFVTFDVPGRRRKRQTFFPVEVV